MTDMQKLLECYSFQLDCLDAGKETPDEMPSAVSKLFAAHGEIIDRLGYPLHDV